MALFANRVSDLLALLEQFLVVLNIRSASLFDPYEALVVHTLDLIRLLFFSLEGGPAIFLKLFVNSCNEVSVEYVFVEVDCKWERPFQEDL